jgi:hypothetical protein
MICRSIEDHLRMLVQANGQTTAGKCLDFWRNLNAEPRHAYASAAETTFTKAMATCC